jgi:hypothetical protein
VGNAGRQEDSTASLRASEERVHAANELPIGGDIDSNQIVPVFRLDMGKRGEGAENASIADEHIEPLVAVVQGKCEPGDTLAVFDVERHKRCRATACLDPVVEFFQPANSACDSHHVRAGLRKLKRKRGANAARGACDQHDTIGEGLGHTR